MLSRHNVRRLKVSTSTWPRKLALGTVLPPQTPCEYVEEALCWWAFGKYDRAAAAQHVHSIQCLYIYIPHIYCIVQYHIGLIILFLISSLSYLIRRLPACLLPLISSMLAVSSQEWLGHGYFWRPADSEGPVENAAGNAMNDFDLLEKDFCDLPKASVLAADRELLRRHFDLQG